MMLRRDLLLFLILATASACSTSTREAGTVKVHGRVTDAGEPLHVDGRDVGIGRVTVGFYRIYDDGERLVEATSADAAADGSFDLIDGIEPGKYLISVHQWNPYPNVDQLKGKFDQRNSKIIRVLEGEEQELIIDLSKPEQ